MPPARPDPAPRVARIIEAALLWARDRPSIHAAGLVGSHARGQARPDSDIDLMFLTADPAAFRDPAWIAEIAWPTEEPDAGGAPCSWRDAGYGVAWSRHVALSGGPEVEFTFAPISWAATDPVEEGTRRVISDGCRILYDPDGLLAQLVRAVQATAR